MTYEAHTLIAPMAYTCCCVAAKCRLWVGQLTFGVRVGWPLEHGHVGLCQRQRATSYAAKWHTMNIGLCSWPFINR